MAAAFIPIWKEAPFIRIILPFITGIVMEYYLQLPTINLWINTSVGFAGICIVSFLNLPLRFKNPWLYGVFINLLLISLGALMASFNNISLPKQPDPPFAVSIKEPLIEKANSWKALASLDDSSRTDIIIYFRKDSSLPGLRYGDKIAFLKSLRPIENLPIFGRFDYKRYCALKNIHYQVFLQHDEFITLNGKNRYFFREFLFDLQSWALQILRKYIMGKKECGLAEALLIGYKNDLDKGLMQAYSNTGVVHVVAISGLHLGLIYALLKYFCYPFLRRKAGKWLTPLIIISGLWVFSLLTGGSPSVMRSAVMFTCIVAGESFSRRTSVYNNLAASAFFLLCYDPNWLWDIGFQLSYAALLSIVIFMEPIYNLVIFKNKIVDAVWKLNAVTLAAQVLATPICVFYFNQFPNLFLVANFLAVPLSSIILIGEIILCLVYFMPFLANFLGYILSFLIRLMNNCVEWLNGFTFSITNGLHISLFQLIIIYAIIIVTTRLLIRTRS